MSNEYSVEAVCPSCRARRPFIARQKRVFITFLFIPLIPVGRGPLRLQCTGCGAQLSAEAFEAAQSAGSEELALALRASVAYILRRVPSPSAKLLTKVSAGMAGIYSISDEYAAAHLRKDCAEFIRYDCLDYVRPVAELLGTRDREEFFTGVAAVGLLAIYEDSLDIAGDVRAIGAAIGLSDAHVNGLMNALAEQLSR